MNRFIDWIFFSFIDTLSGPASRDRDLEFLLRTDKSKYFFLEYNAIVHIIQYFRRSSTKNTNYTYTCHKNPKLLLRFLRLSFVLVQFLHKYQQIYAKYQQKYRVSTELNTNSCHKIPNLCCVRLCFWFLYYLCWRKEDKLCIHYNVLLYGVSLLNFLFTPNLPVCV